MAGEMIPPAVIDIQGDDSSFLATIAKDTALLNKWAATLTKTRLGADEAPLLTDLSTAKTRLLNFARQVYNAKLGADAAPLWNEIAALRAEIKAMSPLDVNFEANMARVEAAIAALKGQLAATQLDVMMTPNISAINTALRAWAASAAGGGGGGGILGFLKGFLKGQSASSILGLGGIAGLASFGSIASLAGFGIEHVITTALGLAGSAAGGLLGGGLLGLGSLGVAGVGMGTDMAGLGQAAGDIKNVVSAQNALNQAIAVYGANSTEAQAAQAQLNYQLASFSPVARSAVLNTSNMIQQFKSMFDKATGMAERQGALIIGQAVKVGEAFIPTIGKYAAQNMGIISKDLQPLFTWLKGPGLQIFNELEAKFQSELPTAMQAFDNGIELLARTIGLVAPQTGGLIKSIDKFVTKMNGADWSKWAGYVNTLIGLFRTWWGFVKLLVEDIALIFTKSAGLGSGIIQTLTGDLQNLHKALGGSTPGLSSLFSSHKSEVIDLIQAIVGIGTAFAKAYLIAAPFFTKVATFFIKAISWVVTFVSKLPGGAAFIGFAILATRISILQNGLKGLITFLGRVVLGMLGVDGASSGMALALGALSTIGILVVATGMALLIQHFGVLHGLMIIGAAAVGVLTLAFIGLDSVPIVAIIAGVILGVAGLVAGIVDLVTHWNSVWNTIKNITTTATAFIKAHLSVFAIAAASVVMGPLGALVAWIATHWNTVKSDAITAWNAIRSALSTAWNAIRTAAVTAWNAIVSFFKSAESKIVAVFSGAKNWLVAAGKAIIDGLVSGLESAASKAYGTIKSIGSKIIGFAKSIWHIASPSQDFIQIGQYLIQGLQQGVSDSGTVAAINNVLQNLASKLLALWKNQVPLWRSTGSALMLGLAQGIADVAGQVASAATTAAQNAVKASKAATKSHSPSEVFAEEGSNWMLGLIQGINKERSAVQGALTSALPKVPRSSGLSSTSSGLGVNVTVQVQQVVVNGGNGSPQAIGEGVQQGMQAHAEAIVKAVKAGAGSQY